MFEKISDDYRPHLLEVHPIRGTEGESLTNYGKAIIEIRMGPLYFDHMCFVPDTVDDVLLGEDLLIFESSVPADMIQSEEKMICREAVMLLKMVR